MIHKRKLGKTGLDVSEIGLGGFQLGAPTKINDKPEAFGGLDETSALNIINTALDLGINTFDTADSYSLGDSEIRLGNALKELRNDVNIFTKAGNIPGVPNWYRDYSYNYLISALDRSLKRLQTDYVDLFQIHTPPQTEQEFDNLEKVFDDIKSEGKARFCGVSVGIHYDKGIELIHRNLVDTIQLYFSLIDPKPLDELLPLAKKNNIGIIVAEPLAQGLLTNKYNLGHRFEKNDLRFYGYSNELLQMKLERVHQLKFLQKNTYSISQAALSYILSREEISVCIPGSKSIQQLNSNVLASEINLTNKDLDRIEKIQHKWDKKISKTG